MRSFSFYSVIVAMAVTVALFACHPPQPSEAPTATASSPATDAGAAEPVRDITPTEARTMPPDLAAFCKDSSCKTYTDERAAMQARVRGRDGGACFVAAWGTCGALRYIEQVPGGLVGLVRYYDEAGQLVAAAQYNIEHGGMTWFGPRQACGRKEADDLCKKPR